MSDFEDITPENFSIIPPEVVAELWGEPNLLSPKPDIDDYNSEVIADLGPKNVRPFGWYEQDYVGGPQQKFQIPLAPNAYRSTLNVLSQNPGSWLPLMTLREYMAGSPSLMISNLNERFRGFGDVLTRTTLDQRHTYVAMATDMTLTEHRPFLIVPGLGGWVTSSEVLPADDSDVTPVDHSEATDDATEIASKPDEDELDEPEIPEEPEIPTKLPDGVPKFADPAAVNRAGYRSLGKVTNTADVNSYTVDVLSDIQKRSGLVLGLNQLRVLRDGRVNLNDETISRHPAGVFVMHRLLKGYPVTGVNYQELLMDAANLGVKGALGLAEDLIARKSVFHSWLTGDERLFLRPTIITDERR